jgi:hypothetical protein
MFIELFLKASRDVHHFWKTRGESALRGRVYIFSYLKEMTKQCCGSGMFFQIPDPTVYHTGSQFFLSSQIRMLDPDPQQKERNGLVNGYTIFLGSSSRRCETDSATARK